jgi:hypothetical protein
LNETLDLLSRLVAQTQIHRLIVAGDLVETPKKCVRTSRDVERFSTWLDERGIQPVFLKGNHDPCRPALPASFQFDGWTILHGDRALPSGPCVLGHYHPALKTGGLTAPCFLIGAKTIVLPALSRNAAGWNVLSGSLPIPLKRESFRCYAGLGDELLDFGQLAAIKAKMTRLADSAPRA